MWAMAASAGRCGRTNVRSSGPESDRRTSALEGSQSQNSGQVAGGWWLVAGGWWLYARLPSGRVRRQKAECMRRMWESDARMGDSSGVGTLESGRGRGKETDVMTVAGGSPEDAY